jgi:hypothetical protein
VLYVDGPTSGSHVMPEAEEIECSRPHGHLPSTRHAGITRELTVVQWDGGPSRDIIPHASSEGVTLDATPEDGASTPPG